MTAYPHAVAPYRDSGLGWPLPLPAGKKAAPPTGYTGAEGDEPSDDDYSRWADQFPIGNVALRLAPHVVGIDVDAYIKNGRQKQGAETLNRLEAAHGPLPATWTSTSRDDGVSGIRLFTVDPALAEDFPGTAGPDIEIIRYGHRYLVAYPSTHPEGMRYRIVGPDGSNGRLPTPDDLPELPDNWVQHLIAAEQCSCVTGTDQPTLPEDTYKPAKFGDVPTAVAALEHALDSGGSRHDTAASVTMALLRFAERDTPGAQTELERLRTLYTRAVAADRGGQKTAEREWDRMVNQGQRKVDADPNPGAGARARAAIVSGGTVDKKLRFTDIDNSTRLIQLHGHQLRYVTEWATWIVWDGTRWLIDRNRVAVSELAKAVSSSLYQQAAETSDPDAARKVAGWAAQTATRGRIDSMIHLARGIDGVVISHERLDTHNWLLGVRNGYINLRTGQFHEPDPAKLMTMQAPVDHDPTATAPRWTQALAEWFPDPEVRSYVQRLSGHASSGDPLGDHVFAIHYGDGRNGKGTYMRAHKHLLGPYYVTPDKSLLIQKRHEEHATVKARLFRTRLAVASETEQRERLNEAQVKNLTGGDPINARRMREDEWEFEPTHSLWLQTNYPPEIHGSDTGIWSRIRVVPWTVTFDGHTDPDLDTNLATETAGILNWIIQGCLDWQNSGLNEPGSVIRATLDYRATEDVLTRYAADTGIEFTRSGTIVDSELKASIGHWATDEGVDKPDAKKINAWMKANGCRESGGNYTNQEGKPSKRKIWKGAHRPRPGEEQSRTPESQALTEESDIPGRTGPMFPVSQPNTPHVKTNRTSGSTASHQPTEDNGNPDTPPIPACLGCGKMPNAIYPSGLCGDCDAAMVAP